MTLPELETWLGKTETTEVLLSVDFMHLISAGFGQSRLTHGQEIPHLGMWFCFPPLFSRGDPSQEFLPFRPGFLTPENDRKRKCEGGRLSFKKPLVVGAMAERRSTIIFISEKIEPAGKVLLGTVESVYSQFGDVCVIEEMDFVYRNASAPKGPVKVSLDTFDWSEIHALNTIPIGEKRDNEFAERCSLCGSVGTIDGQGSVGSVIPTLLIATLNLRAFEKANPDRHVREFYFREIRPLNCDESFNVAGCIIDPGVAHLQAANAFEIAQLATVRFAQ